MRESPRAEPEPAPSSLPMPEPPKKQVDLSQTLPQGQKLENVPLVWQYAKAKAPRERPAAVPASEVLKEAPQTEPEPLSEQHRDNPHGAPTRRMEDILTKRDPRGDKR
jgi:hypothetical protein